MKPEMLLLLWAVVLTFAHVLIAASGAFMQVGLPMLAGNRDNMPALTGWAGRAQRAHRNMLENLVLSLRRSYSWSSQRVGPTR